jgi:tRNA threonylcarbamoyladenosine biosynthesis protein TsaE
MKTFNNIGFNNINEILNYISDYLKPGYTIGLSGTLGTGKTYLVNRISEYLNFNTIMTSPTFTLLNQYKHPYENYYLNHFDVYRLDNVLELEDIGYYDYIENNDYLNIIEWSDKIESELPKTNLLLINIKYSEDLNFRDYNIKVV